MASQGGNHAIAVVDTEALLEILDTNNNYVKSRCLEGLKNGEIIVPSTVWSELEAAYEDYASSLPGSIAKVPLSKSIRKGASKIVENTRSGLSFGAYNENTHLYAASTAWLKECTLLTVSASVSSYEKMDCCDVKELHDWANKWAP